MGSKAGIAERRLRPLWDAIDTRQYKTALKLASSLQARHPESSYLLALKALVVERIGKPDEALQLCNQARALFPVDELTLNTLQMVYNRLHLLEETTACYEYACSRVTNNAELLMELFKCYVRQHLYVKQQQVAMKLYKQIGEERFLLWAVCSILMQVGSEKESSGKLIALAEALLNKRIETNGLHDLEALMLYINVLQQQEKYEIALQVLSGSMGDVFSIQNDKLRLQGELLMCTQQHEKAAEVFERILKISSDDWGVFLSYLDASLARTERVDDASDSVCSKIQEDMIDKNLDKVLDLVKELQGLQVEELRRGPLLAISEIETKRMALKWKYCKASLPEDQSGPLITSILDYYDKFGHLASFSSDVSAFVENIDETKKLQLSTALLEASARNLLTNPVKQLRRKISAFQVEEQLGVKLRLSDEDLISHAAEIAKLYLESLELAVDLNAHETMHDGEELLVLCANLLVEVFRRSQHFGYILEAILILEFGLFARRNNSQYKLLLIDLYSTVSAIVPALERYRALDVKFVLVESLSHLILPGLLGSSGWADLQNLVKDSLRFYDNHQMESAELAILAYQHCTYSKVLEFVEFGKRLERSHQHLVFKIEAAILSIKQKADKLEEFELGLAGLEFGKKAVKWSSDEFFVSMSFNEDLQTRPWWSPMPNKSYLAGSSRNIGGEKIWRYVETEDERVCREHLWKSSLRRRCLVPRILFLMLESVKQTAFVEGSDSNGAMGEFKALLGEFLKTRSLQFDDIENWLSEAGLSQRVFEDCQISPVEVLTFAIFWAIYLLTSGVAGRNVEMLSVVARVMENIIDESLKGFMMYSPSVRCGENTFEVMTAGTAISNLVGLTSESFAWLGLYLQAWAKRLQPISKKKKKKGAGSVDQTNNPAANHVAPYLESLRTASIGPLEKLSACVSDYLRRPLESEVVDLLSLLNQDSKLSSVPSGAVLSVLLGRVSVASELAARTLGAKQSWSTEKCVRDTVDSRRVTATGIQDLCTARLTLLKSLKF